MLQRRKNKRKSSYIISYGKASLLENKVGGFFASFFFSCRLTVVKHTSVGQQQRDQFGVLVQLHGVLALVGKQSANVNGEIHFVGEAREERQHQFVVVIWWNKVRRQSIALAEIVW